MTNTILVGRRTGKTLLQQKEMREFTRKHPDAIIVEVSPGGVRVEKPVVLHPEQHPIPRLLADG